ncbi:MAG: acetyltransferase [Rhodomicrobium sp.]|nr:acetyltransferase [Rhodomicrobium sp.]
MTEAGPQIEFIPVSHDHLPLLERWLHEPHWRQWWGDPDIELGFIRNMVEGRDTTKPYLFIIDGKPSGYIQVWFVGDHQNASWIAEHHWLGELPPETVGVDLSIAEPNDLSRGLGTAVLNAFVARLRAEGRTLIIIDPDPANRRAVRAYEKAGFRPLPHLLGRTGDCLILIHQPLDKPIQ